MTAVGMNHPKSSKLRLYESRKMGGKGLINIQEACHKKESPLRTYFLGSESALFQELHRIDRGDIALLLQSKTK